MVEADRALEEGEEGVGVDRAELEAGLLHQHRVHPGALLLLPETDISHRPGPRIERAVAGKRGAEETGGDRRDTRVLVT